MPKYWTTLHRTSIFLSKADKEDLKSIGNGEISGGIRLLIKQHKANQKTTGYRGRPKKTTTN